MTHATIPEPADLDRVRKTLLTICAHASHEPVDHADALRRLSLIRFMANAALARLDDDRGYL